MTKPRITSPEASKGTKRRRSSQLAGVREVVSGSPEAATAQLQEELGREEREKMLYSSGFNSKITPQEALAMKVNLNLPWKKLRIMRRYN